MDEKVEIPAAPTSGHIDLTIERPQESDVKLIAFYLPQFHPIPENDAAWGRGFTEWTNVTKSTPLFAGHYQPHLPGEFGFYDLRVPEVLCQQADLAKSYGIHGFCFYYYWFDGRRLLEKPLETMLATGQPDMPFCVCWANENWSRRWDGSEQEIIVAQTFSEEMRSKIIEDLIPYFMDRRYIRVGSRPLFLVYRPGVVPDLRETIEVWRKTAREHGLELHISACLTFGFSNPCSFGFDSAVEFPPHGVAASEITKTIDEWSGPFEGKVFSYDDVVKNEITKPEPPYTVFRTVMAGWDNTPRRGKHAHCFFGAEPKIFGAWLAALVMRCKRLSTRDQRIIFINAWNEWAEGAHIEPDREFGRQWLAACARAIRDQGEPLDSDTWLSVVAELENSTNDANNPPLRTALDILRRYQQRVLALEAVNLALSTFYLHWLDNEPFRQSSRVVLAERLREAFRLRPGHLASGLDFPSGAGPIFFYRARPQYLRGWICYSEVPDEPSEATRLVVSLGAEDDLGQSYLAFGSHGLARPDVAEAHPEFLPLLAEKSGFEIHIDLREMVPGRYMMLLGIGSLSDIIFSAEPTRILVL